MPVALILSSYVAASRIGGGAQPYALAAFGIDPILVPTVMFGASPAKGAKGRAVDAELFEQLLEGLDIQGLVGRIDLVVTGHFSLPEQVALARRTIDRLRDAGAAPLVVVDPILGDAPKGLYVKPEVADALAGQLVPAADWLTPNLWELSHLTGRTVVDAASAAEAVRALGRPALVTSVPGAGEEIGLLCCAPDGVTLVTHPRRDGVPNGTGDLVCAVFAAGLTRGLSPAAAAEGAAGAVAEALEEAAARPCPVDLPLVGLGERLARPNVRLNVTRIA